ERPGVGSRPRVARGPERRRPGTPRGPLAPRGRDRGAAGNGPRAAGTRGLGRACERPPGALAVFPSRPGRGRGRGGDVAGPADRRDGRGGNRRHGLCGGRRSGGRDLPSRRPRRRSSERGVQRVRQSTARV
ncbi:MAG: hypothetical protein AVDCRST_MAG02-2071, partial [uncultured Rubrobacteraceae bacterium]